MKNRPPRKTRQKDRGRNKEKKVDNTRRKTETRDKPTMKGKKAKNEGMKEILPFRVCKSVHHHTFK
jgi:hypothetical protein